MLAEKSAWKLLAENSLLPACLVVNWSERPCQHKMFVCYLNTDHSACDLRVWSKAKPEVTRYQNDGQVSCPLLKSPYQYCNTPYFRFWLLGNCHVAMHMMCKIHLEPYCNGLVSAIGWFPMTFLNSRNRSHQKVWIILNHVWQVYGRRREWNENIEVSMKYHLQDTSWKLHMKVTFGVLRWRVLREHSKAQLGTKSMWLLPCQQLAPRNSRLQNITFEATFGPSIW